MRRTINNKRQPEPRPCPKCDRQMTLTQQTVDRKSEKLRPYCDPSKGGCGFKGEPTLVTWDELMAFDAKEKSGSFQPSALN